MRDAGRPPVRPAPDSRAVRKGRLGPGAALRVCLTSVPPRQAPRISEALLAARVAACVSAVPGVVSAYRWKGKLERSRETLLLVKTSAAALARCVALLAKIHPYEVPEILVTTPTRAATAYAAWVRAEAH